MKLAEPIRRAWCGGTASQYKGHTHGGVAESSWPIQRSYTNGGGGIKLASMKVIREWCEGVASTKVIHERWCGGIAGQYEVHTRTCKECWSVWTSKRLVV
ncbi:hypothetical protein CEXT_540261 [Caerostris extrusa]|uniref:Uncharacterized protein n=1 Tax=Caerostris extrusa TaxID=172846 RepID=A0AAV4WEL3_CAEEX|nr:hypothetical protein CEXT_540261 [Caerostris extrusa]